MAVYSNLVDFYKYQQCGFKSITLINERYSHKNRSEREDKVLYKYFSLIHKTVDEGDVRHRR